LKGKKNEVTFRHHEKAEKGIYILGICGEKKSSLLSNAHFCPHLQKIHRFCTLPPEHTFVISFCPDKHAQCIYVLPPIHSLSLLRQLFSGLRWQQQNPKVTHANARLIRKSAPRNARQPAIGSTINLAAGIQVNFRLPLP